VTIDFAKIAPYLQDPLVLIGFFLFLGFLFVRGVLKAGIIPQLSQTLGYRVLQRILLYGFIIALALMAVGVFLKYRELSAQEQAAAVRMLDQELTGNLAVLSELKKNTETILGATSAVSSVMRTPGIKLLSGLFPADNLDPLKPVPASADYARDLLDAVQASGLLDDETEKRKFALAASAISGTIDRTMSTIKSLADVDGRRYIVKSDVWQSQLPILRRVVIVDVVRFQQSYTELELARANYNVVVSNCINYLSATGRFFGDPQRRITREGLAEVLASERLFIEITAAYAPKLVENIHNTREISDKMRASLANL
jgi:hypothetical protein